MSKYKNYRPMETWTVEILAGPIENRTSHVFTGMSKGAGDLFFEKTDVLRKRGVEGPFFGGRKARGETL